MSEHENKRAADRRLALLALASEQSDPSGPCPSAETLAVLAEGRLSQEEAGACLAHMADCEDCYALWLRLDQEWQQRQHTSKKIALLRLVRRPRFLTTVGSLLAAAASVVLMLNLPITQVDRVNLPQMREKTMPELVMPPAADIAPPQAKSIPAEQQDQPLPASKHLARLTEQAEIETSRQETYAQDANTARRAAPLAVVRERERMETKEKAVAPPAGAGQAVEKGRRQEVAASLQPEQERVPVVAEEWYARIRQGCQDEPKADFFSAIAAQGHRLLREPAALSGQERQRIERIVAELGRKQPAGGRCAALLELLVPTNQ